MFKVTKPHLFLHIFERDDHTCRYCGDPATEIDHVIPRSHHGTNGDDNLVACCHRCNSTACSGRFESFEEKRAWILERRALRAAKPRPPDSRTTKGVKAEAKRRGLPVWVVYRDRSRRRKP